MGVVWQRWESGFFVERPHDVVSTVDEIILT